MKKSFFFSLLFLFSIAAITQTSLSGKVTDADTGEELIGANISFYKNGNFILAINTDGNGNYKVNLDPGSYRVEAYSLGFPTAITTEVLVNAGQNNRFDIKFGETDGCDAFVISSYREPLLSKDNTTSGLILDQKKIRMAPSKNINFIAGGTSGISFSW